MADTLAFDILARDRASGSFRTAASSASDLSEKMGIAAKSALVLDEALKRQRKAADTSVEATIALAKADKILADAEKDAAGDALLADVAIRKQSRNAEKASSGFDTAATSLSGMITPMTGLIAAGVALSPVIVTLGVGTAGLAAAAYGAVSPVLKAAQATGGLAANMGKLNPEQRQVALSLQSLGADYSQFSRALQPELFAVFNAGLGVARTLLHEVEPVAAATGKALTQVVAAIGADLKTAEWRNFFAFMAKTAPGDVLALGKAIGALVNALPPLLEDLQPLARLLLEVTADAGHAASALTALSQASASQAENQRVAANVGVRYATLVQALTGFITGNTKAEASALAARYASATAAKTAARQLHAMAQSVTDVMNAEDAALQKQLGYSNSLIQAANDAVTLRGALRKSHHEIGLHTQAQRDSFSAANTYINDLEQAAQKAIDSGHGARTAAANIRSGLGILDSAKTKNRLYWQEVRTLVGWLDKLRAEGPITERISVITSATSAGGHGPGHPLGHAAGGWASGLIMTGERGRELLQVPPGSYVFNHAQTEAMMAGRDGAWPAAVTGGRGRGGGNTYNLNVSVPPGGEREAGRQIVAAIRKFEQGSGHGWRK